MSSLGLETQEKEAAVASLYTHYKLPKKALPFLLSLAILVIALSISHGLIDLGILHRPCPCQNIHSLGTSLTQGFLYCLPQLCHEVQKLCGLHTHEWICDWGHVFPSGFLCLISYLYSMGQCSFSRTRSPDPYPSGLDFPTCKTMWQYIWGSINWTVLDTL